MTRYYCAVLFLLFGSRIIFSQNNTYDFLRLDISPRTAALAGSFVAGTDDPNIIFYNPAGINFLENTPVSFSYLNHLMDIQLASFAISKEFGNLGHFSFGTEYINYGDFTRRDADGNNLGQFGAGDVAFLLGYGNELDKNFFYGANVKFLYSKIDNVNSTGLCLDLGLQYYFVTQNINIGFSILNIGEQLNSYYSTKEKLPLDVRFGFSKRFTRLPFMLYFNFSKLNEEQDKFSDKVKNFSFGGEFNLSKVIRVRLGYDNEKRQDLLIGSTAGLAGISIGVGLKISGYSFDYAYSSLGLIGGLNRIGITTSF
jgi:hypothetical protein